ncbi:nuclear transport factor 2 family protein [Marinigracilibium pacificum]|uniref:Nuclear transport factor 2 family protein n=1 Tax=Marinigracilibium pacificum TaxID=2729599 RepID=A0A848IZZ5_9BACT|nr:nuclear transport factor 2 family protein [Marinigracilibium pacificum]NMM47794.1 nuclear transport factor 2 family protein [Marinigracilibium pacificum]
MKYKILLIQFIFLSFSGFGQYHDYEDINNQVWAKFEKAFVDLNPGLMAEIHSRDLARIPADNNRILNYEEYIDSFHKRFDRAKSNHIKYEIELRFIERIANGFTASERGIYQLIVINEQDEPRSYYGKFHVLLRKENGLWKILMDYDSNEGGKIGKEDFDKANEIDDFNF